MEVKRFAHYNPAMFLAGDVGGTKTILGLFARAPGRPRSVFNASFRTLDYPDLVSIVRVFLDDAHVTSAQIEHACFGVAGPVENGRAKLTNVPWTVDADAMRNQLPTARAHVLNDLEAMAWGVTVLERSEIEVLWEGDPDPSAGMSLIAAGTGLGVALLPKAAGRVAPMASEGGHADFAPRTDAEETLRRALTREFGRAEIEQVLSGPGLHNIQRFVYPHRCAGLARTARDTDAPAAISEAALNGTCSGCRSSLELFVSCYGACAGNLVLTAMSTGGVFLGGGIAPRNLAALKWPVFLESFFAKAPLEHVLRRTPVSVILNPSIGLIGAATFAMVIDDDLAV